MFKKLMVIMMAAIISIALIGCSQSVEDKTVDSSKDSDSTSLSDNSYETSKKDTETDISKKDPPSNQKGDIKKEFEKKDKDLDPVKAKVQLYEGNYFDSMLYGENRPNPYMEVHISNITDTSFDFAIYEVTDYNEADRKLIFMKNTAIFIEDGNKAAFYGNDYTLYFTFPNDHGAYPVATDMCIEGFDPMKGKTFVNNGIPGHEFG